MDKKSRTGILGAISDWLKLLALIVLVAEAVIFAAMKMTPKTHSIYDWYPIFLLVFLIPVVVGIFLDRYWQIKQTEKIQTLNLEEKSLSVDTSNMTMPSERLQKNITDMYVDSPKGYLFSRPKLQGWSDPVESNSMAEALKAGLLSDIPDGEDPIKFASIMPMGEMFAKSQLVSFKYGEPVLCQLTEDTSTKAADSIIHKMKTLWEKEGEPPPSNEWIKEFRKGMVRSGVGFKIPENFSLQNTFSVTILDKALSQESPITPNLGNVFLLNSKFTNEFVDKIEANESSILWGSRSLATNILVNNELKELIVYRLTRLLETNKNFYSLSIVFSPQTNAPIEIWDEMKEMFNSFRAIV